jgi:hypothetical protein
MAHCYQCGAKIVSGYEVRMKVQSGTSISGFNFSPWLPFNFVLNAIVKQRIPSVRNYYSLRTLCPICANTLQHSERTKMLVAAVVVIAVLIAAAASLMR